MWSMGLWHPGSMGPGDPGCFHTLDSQGCRRINDNITNEINSIQYYINNINPEVNKTLSYHTNHTDFMYQKFNTNNNFDNRRKFTIQNNYFTYQRRITHTDEYDLRIALLEATVMNLQTQINNLPLGGGGGSGIDGGVINI